MDNYCILREKIRVYLGFIKRLTKAGLSLRSWASKTLTTFIIEYDRLIFDFIDNLFWLKKVQSSLFDCVWKTAMGSS
jgi:hypothetical protein